MNGVYIINQCPMPLLNLYLAVAAADTVTHRVGVRSARVAAVHEVKERVVAPALVDPHEHVLNCPLHHFLGEERRGRVLVRGGVAPVGSGEEVRRGVLATCHAAHESGQNAGRNTP